MRIIARRTLKEFWEAGHSDAEQPLKAWFAEVSRATWSSMADVKARYRHASVIDGERVVFNIGGNKYRLVVQINYAYRIVYVRFIGSHQEYDRIDVESV